ncbi:MAG: hypothetical protein HYS14_05080 [Candidatus Rokubacteria bacterium]|nr:hypothetical protein [Candidatus Rokubacteria bacterium]
MKGIRVLLMIALLLAALPAVSFAEGFSFIDVFPVVRASSQLLLNSLVIVKGNVSGLALAGVAKCYDGSGINVVNTNFLMPAGAINTATAIFLATAVCPGTDPVSMVIHDALFVSFIGGEQIAFWAAGTPSRHPARGFLGGANWEGYKSTSKLWITLLPAGIGVTNRLILHCPARDQAVFMGLPGCQGTGGTTVVIDFLGSGLTTQNYVANNIVAQTATAWNPSAPSGGVLLITAPPGGRKIEGVTVLDAGTWQASMFLLSNTLGF